MKQILNMIGGLLLGLAAFGADASSVHGTVVSAGPNGEPFAVPAAQVKLIGASSMQLESDEKGAYVFADVPPGVYRIEVKAPGLTGTSSVTVAAGEEVEATVTVEVEESIYSVTVSDSATPVSAQSISRDVLGDDALKGAPNANDRLENALPLIPGVLRGPDGLINMKGARSSQNGSLVNGANVTDPVTGAAAIRLPIDVVSSVQVISNPYDPEYGRLAGAVSTVDTRPGNFERFHMSLQNFMVRPRWRDGSIVGIESATPRVTLTGPVWKNKMAFTQSFEYRFVRTPVKSLPPLQRDTKLESFDSYSQLDWMINGKQSATVSLAIYPQKLDYLGLNTFTPQPATPNLHQRGSMTSIQHRYITGSDSLLVSQFSYKRLDADVTAQSNDLYRLLLETTQGGFFHRQHRETFRTEWQETYHFGRINALGTHQVKSGVNFAHSSYDGRANLLPVDLAGASGATVQRIDFGPASAFSVSQNEAAWFVADKWSPVRRLTVDYGVRLDYDSITHSTNSAPRAGLAYDLTGDGRTLLKGGAGLFYDRVMLNVPVFPMLPNRTVTTLASDGSAISVVPYTNVIAGNLQNPRSTAWNVELDRQVLDRLVVRVGYEQRNANRDFVVGPFTENGLSTIAVSNGGHNTYREFQVMGRYKFRRHMVNVSYVRSKAWGDLNDFNQFFGNTPQIVVQPNQRGRLPFDAPNRFLFWGEYQAPGKIVLAPVVDLHTGFPYSAQNELRQYVGERNVQRMPAFASVDLQVTRQLRVPVFGRVRAGFSVFNVLNHFNPRDVQNNIASENYGGFYNGPGRTFRGKFAKEF